MVLFEVAIIINSWPNWIELVVLGLRSRVATLETKQDTHKKKNEIKYRKNNNKNNLQTKKWKVERSMLREPKCGDLFFFFGLHTRAEPRTQLIEQLANPPKLLVIRLFLKTEQIDLISSVL